MDDQSHRAGFHPADSYGGLAVASDTMRSATTLQAWRELMNDEYGAVDYRLWNSDTFAGSIISRYFMDIGIHEIAGTPLIADRRPGCGARHGSRVTKVVWQKSGECHFVQADRRVELSPGDLAFLDFDSPYQFTTSSPFRQLVLHVPTEILLDHDAFAGERVSLSATRVSRRNVPRPWCALLDLADGELGADMLHASVYESVMFVLAHLGSLASTNARVVPSPPTMYERARQYIRSACEDPDLSPDDVAAALSISRRTLFRVFQEGPQGFEETLISQRLTRSSELLASPRVDLTVEAVAQRSGFKSVSHFHARFTQHYRMTPREYKRLRARVGLRGPFRGTSRVRVGGGVAG